MDGVQVANSAFASRRRFCAERIVCNHEAESENLFINNSELACAGRPLGDRKVYLPLSKDLVLPESLNPNEDLRQSERLRPSAEAIAAQKRVDKYLNLIASICNVSGQGGLGRSPVILCNLTGYVEECGLAVACRACLAGNHFADCHCSANKEPVLPAGQKGARFSKEIPRDKEVRNFSGT